jgi:hypothetical protein
MRLIGFIDSYTRHEGIRGSGGMGPLILTALGGISGQFQASVTLPPGKGTRRKGGWVTPHRQSAQFGEEHTLFSPAGNRTKILRLFSP